jgi:hypothetical protein
MQAGEVFMWDCALEDCLHWLKKFNQARRLCLAYGLAPLVLENSASTKQSLRDLDRAGFGTARKLLSHRLSAECRDTGLPWETIVGFRLAARWRLLDESTRAWSLLAKKGWKDEAIAKLSRGMALLLVEKLTSKEVEHDPVEGVVQMASVLPFERLVELSAADRLNRRQSHAAETQADLLRRLELKPETPGYLHVWLSNQVIGTFQPWQLFNAAHDPAVRGISPNFRVTACVDEAKARVRATQAFSNYAGKGQIIALIDSGVDDRHPDLAGRVAHKKHYNQTAKQEDEFGHGTHLAGIVAGKCAGNFGGVAPESKLWCYRVLDETGHSTRKDVTDAVQQVVADAVNAVRTGELAESNKIVLNCSIEAKLDEFLSPDDYEGFCNHFDEACSDAVVVTAAGNSGPQPATITAPGGGFRVLTVGATANRGAGMLNVVAPFSSRGPAIGNRVKPDVVAPGGFENPEGHIYEQVSVLSSRVTGCALDRRTLLDKPWRRDPSDLDHYGLSGTSQAAALVSGLAALLVEHAMRKRGGTRHAFIADALRSSARTLQYSKYEEGAGLVNVDAAMSAL